MSNVPAAVPSLGCHEHLFLSVMQIKKIEAGVLTDCALHRELAAVCDRKLARATGLPAMKSDVGQRPVILAWV